MEERGLWFASLDNQQVMAQLDTEARGLSLPEAAARLVSHGPNTLTTGGVSARAVFVRQFRSWFVLLLFVAAGIALGLGEYLDTGLILLFVCINAGLGFAQEFRAEHTLSLLGRLIPRKAHVRREGVVSLIDVAHVVPGDVIVLAAGDQVPADVRVLSADGLAVDESTLTGESAPVFKDAQPDTRATDALRLRNALHSGTVVVSGQAEAVVFATGKRTLIGGIARLATQTAETSELAKGIAGFSKFILVLTLTTLVVVLLVKYALAPQSFSLPTYLIFAIALAVGVIPEALPLVITVSLSAGGERLAKKKVVPRRLSAIEDLGSIQVLCTDKTGTITENALTVSDVWGPRDEVLQAAVRGASFWQTEEAQPNNSFDRAVWQVAGKQASRSIAGWSHVQALPFTPDRRRNAVLLADRAGRHHVVVRGAWEAVLPCCSGISTQDRSEIRAWVDARGQEGKRILVIAERSGVSGDVDLAKAERQGLHLLGAVAFNDPLKTDARSTIQSAEDMGVQVKILTGDSPEVAGAVAKQIGLIPHAGEVVSGEAFARFSDEQKHTIVQSQHVFARVSPQQKYEIIGLLSQHAVVGFLGEGVNDVPALKRAHVGLVVDGAADVAKDAADIVLLNHSLAVIIDGITEGRRTFANTIKYIRSTLTSNFGNFFALAIASLFIPFLPMLPVQILLVNLLSDFPMISIAADRIDPKDLRRPESYQVRDVAFMAVVLGLVSTVFDFIFFAWFQPLGAGPLQTMWWAGSIITELALFYSIRTRLPFWRGGAPSRMVGVLTATATVAALVIPFVPWFQRTFHFVRPEPLWYIALLVIVAAYFCTTECVKLAYVRFFANGQGKKV